MLWAQRRGLHQQYCDSAFSKMTLGKRDLIGLERFVQICRDELHMNLTEVELARIFSRLDTNGDKALTYDEFRRGLEYTYILRAISWSCTHQKTCTLPQGYDFSVPTHIAHRHPDYVAENAAGTSSQSEYDPAKHGAVYGRFASFRREVDYAWHTNYTRERQEWQDHVVKMVADQSQKRQERPWVIFTCGAMGAGKGYTMNWLSEQGILPIECLVHIDPDYFKSLMPEWDGYKKFDESSAGSMCHTESGFIQELAEKAALRGSQHTWIDGSLGDHRWFSNVFANIRVKHPQYRIALVYVYASDEEVYKRAAERGKQTGRFIPQDTLATSLRKTRESVAVLGPLVDCLVEVRNETREPVLDRCEVRLRSFAMMQHAFSIDG